MGSITIFGGQDTSVLTEAAARAAQGATQLEEAAHQLVLASLALAVSAAAWSWAGASLSRGRLPANRWEAATLQASACQRCADEAGRLGALLGSVGAEAETIGRDLLVAEAVYADAETAAHLLVANATRLAAGAAGFLGSTLATAPAFGAFAAALAGPVVAGAGVFSVVTGGRFLAGATSAVVRGAAPFTDDAMAGLGWGIAAAHPRAANGNLSVRGAAAAALGVARSLFASATVRVDRLPPSQFTDRANAEAGTIAAALHLMGALYPGRVDASLPPGLSGASAIPPGTIAVQRVEHADGAVTWTVLVPGTQALTPGANPLDALSDVEIVGTHACDATKAVELALAEAGAGLGEPVVLFGHSLGGMVVMALAESDRFRERHPVAGVVTAGSPTGDFLVPPDIPVINIENRQELVSNLDGMDASANPVGVNRLVIFKDLAASPNPADREAAGSISAAHGLPTHQRAWDEALALGSPRVQAVSGTIEPLLTGAVVTTTLFTATRTLESRAPNAADGRSRLPRSVVVGHEPETEAEVTSGASSGRTRSGSTGTRR